MSPRLTYIAFRATASLIALGLAAPMGLSLFL
jgi:hypothetical protein